MRGFLTFASAAALLAAPVSAHEAQSETEAVTAAVDAFFVALRDPDKTALAQTMIQEGVIFVHDRRDPENTRTVALPVSDHLENWTQSPPGTDEYMTYESVFVDGEMAHVWGPYVFLINGNPTHCGINSMSLAKTPEGWRVSNTSFTMTSLDECEPLGAPEVPTE